MAVTGDELVDVVDPYRCEDCLATGDECRFHAGWAAGWDACAAFVARVVEDERAAEVAELATDRAAGAAVPVEDEGED